MRFRESSTEKELSKKDLCSHIIAMFRSSEYDEPKKAYISKIMDDERDSPTYGKHVLTRYRFVHEDGYQVSFKVPVEVFNPFAGAR